MQSYHFLVVDDHPLYREAVLNVLTDLYLETVRSVRSQVWQD